MKKLFMMLTIGILSFLLLSLCSVSVGINSLKRGVSHPGDIIDVSLSNLYPTLGEPLDIFIIVQGNPEGKRFEETITLTDDFEGFTVTSSGVEWTAGQVLVDQLNITIGRASTYTKKIEWYPSIVGNHTFHCTTGNSTEKTINVSVGFDVQTIIVPSLGCPRIISKNATSELSVLVSEERSGTEEPADIVHVELQDVAGSSHYTVCGETREFRTWILAGETTIEDELLASYDVSAVPCGFYNLSVTTAKNSYSWPHAVYIIKQEPAAFTFVQLSDIHIGKSYNLVDEKRKFAQAITYVNEHIHPDFVVLTGDLVDWLNHRAPRTFFDDLKDILLTCKSPVFTIPGNHDRYENRLLLLYAPFYNLTSYHRTLNPLNDYSFEYGGVNFVFLDSGYDYSRWEIKLMIWNLTPEGSGLTNTQMYLLENRLGNTKKNQILLLHHPAVNNHDDTGLFALHDTLPSGNDECIAINRGAFIDYCREGNVSLVLSGHTHTNKVLTWEGKKTLDPFLWPLFVQTDSATLKGAQSGGQVITVQNGIIKQYHYIPFM